MGILKGFKDLKDMAHEAPGLMAQGNQLAAAAQANAAAQQAAPSPYLVPGPAPMAAAVAGSAPTDAIAGVDLPLYATISRSFAEVGYDQGRGPELAARHGVGAAEWQAAMDGWNARITADPSVAAQFNALYMGR